MISALPLSAVAAEMKPLSDVIIEDDFLVKEYGYDMSKKDSDGKTIFDPSANLGTGWNGIWTSDGQLQYYYDTGWRSNSICFNTGVAKNAYRNFANSIDFSKDGKYEIRWQSIYSDHGGENYRGLSLASGDTRILNFSADKGYLIIYHNGTEKIRSEGNTSSSDLSNYVVEITVNSSGEDTIKFKTYKKDAEEPSTWNVETTFELGNSVIDNMKFSYWRGGVSNVAIYSSEISFGKNVIEGTGTDFEKVNDNSETTVWNANNDYAVINMKKPVKITSYEALGLNGTFELYASENGNVENAEKIADLSSDRNSVSTDKVGRYIIVKGTGSLGEINLWGDGYKDDYLNVPEIYAGSERVLGNKNVLSSNEKIVIDFEENIVASKTGAVSLTLDGKSVPVTYSVSDDKITVVTSKALEGECVLTVSGNVENSSGVKMPDGKDFVAKFSGVKDIEVTENTIKNNSASSVTVVPVTVSGNTVTTGSDITVNANDTENYGGNIVVNDFTTLSPASVKNAVVNTVTLDEEIAVDKENNTATVTGYVSGVNMQKIGGRDVVVAVTSMNDSLEASKVIDMKKVVTDDNGHFSVTLTMDANKGGFFKPYVATNYSTAPATEKFYYISEQGETNILQAFTNATTVEAMESAISDNLADLGIEASSYNTKIDTLVANIASEVLNEKAILTDVSKIAEVVRAGLVKEDVKNSSSDQIKTILENKYEDFGAVNTGWEKLDDSEKTAVAGNIYTSKNNIKTSADLKELYNAFVEEQLQIKSPVTVPDVTSKNVSTNVGESVVLTVSTNTAKVNTLSMTVKYDATKLSYVKHTAQNDKMVVIDDGNGNITVSLPQISATENSYDLKESETLTIEFMPKDGNAFTSDATVTSKMSVYDSNLLMMREYSSENKITVSASKMEGEGNPSGSIGGGGSAGGGSSSSGSSKGDYTGSYTPTGGTTAKPQEEEKTQLFTDLENCTWAKEAIDYLAENEIINGIGENIFAPDNNVKREEFAKMLVLAFNLYNENAKCDFTDVKTSDWFYGYVASAVENDLINGMDENTFGTGEYITREQMTAMLYRAVMKFAPYVTYEKEVEYADETQISDWAVESVNAMSYFGAVKGVGNNAFAPKGTATRAQSACIIYRVLQLFDETIGK